LRSVGRIGLPAWGDGALAAVLSLFALLDVSLLRLTPELAGHGAAAAVLAALVPIPLAWRRRAPVGAAGAAAVTVGVQALVVAPTTALAQVVSQLVLAFSVAVHAPARRALIGLGALVAAIEVVSVRSGSSVAQILSVVPFLAVPFAAGLSVRASRTHASQLERLTDDLTKERQRSASLAVTDERRRIARDLHDVVAHGVGVMAVQAGGARLVLDVDLERARGALVTIENTGRTALAELERMVTLLRAPGDSERASPLPLLADLPALFGQLRAGGVDVDYAAGDATGLPLLLQTTAYRVVQEAMTNAVKHAPGAPVHVRCRILVDELHVDVVDEGAQVRGARAAVLGGHGLVGMRERVALFEGTLDADALADGGWAVCARLPFSAGGAALL